MEDVFTRSLIQLSKQALPFPWRRESAAAKEETFAYAVHGLPPGEQAFISQFGDTWRTMKYKNGLPGSWAGAYATAEEALETLQESYREKAGSVAGNR